MSTLSMPIFFKTSVARKFNLFDKILKICSSIKKKKKFVVQLTLFDMYIIVS